MSKNRRLGRGIDALLQGRDLSQLESETNRVVAVPIENLQPNPDQPRTVFDEQALDELARSIEERGIIQPILAEKSGEDTYTIIAGERRFRAAKRAGLSVVPVLPGVFSEDEKLEIALLENIQRADLNPMEEAAAYAELMKRSGVSQEELARRLGKSRPAIANSVRLLNLTESVRSAVSDGRLSAGHARALLATEDGSVQEQLALHIEKHGLTVRAVEEVVASLRRGETLEAVLAAREQGAGAAERSDGSADSTGVKRGGGAKSEPRKSVELRTIEEQLIERLGTRVVIHGSDSRGRIEISYLSLDDLDRLVEIISGSAD